MLGISFTLPIGKYKAYQTRNCVILTYCCDLIKTKAIYYFVPYVFFLTNALIAMLTTYVMTKMYLNIPPIFDMKKMFKAHHFN